MMRFKPNSIIHGDCLDWLPSIPSESIDMCYIDPPFFTQRDFGEFSDKWKNGINEYIDFMNCRVKEIHRALKTTGTIFLHCDLRASHYLKLMLDEIFSYKNFINEITLKKSIVRTFRKKGFDNLSDKILFYSKFKNNYKFKTIYKNETQQQIEKKFKYIEKETGRRFQHIVLEVSSNSSNKNEVRIINGKEVKTKLGWRWSQEKFDKELKKNPYIIYLTKNGRPRFKQYLDEYKGIGIGDIWTDIFSLFSNDKERLGYPTQKPELLLKRIIECSTDKGDLILDCFGGSGTTAAVAMKLRRKFITGDVSKEACEIMESRLVKIGPFHTEDGEVISDESVFYRDSEYSLKTDHDEL